MIARRLCLRHPIAALALLLVAGAPAPARAALPQPPLSADRFRVQVDGVDVPRMLRFEFLRRAEADDRRIERLMPVRLTRSLSDVVGGNTDFLKWVQQAQSGLPGARKEVSLLVYDAGLAEAGRVVLGQCVAVAWSGPELSTRGDVPAVVESVDLACRSVQLGGAF